MEPSSTPPTPCPDPDLAPAALPDPPPETGLSPLRRTLALLTLCYLGFLTPLASTALLVAVPEIAADFSTSGTIINISNALFFVSMAVSPMFWGPLLNVIGRRPVFLAAGVLLAAFLAGTAAAPSLAAFIAFRVLTAFQGTAYLVAGSVVVGDLYPPESRGRALGWFMSGILVGPSFAPLLGGIVLTLASWRVIFWVLAVMAVAGVAFIFFLLPETMPTAPEPLPGIVPLCRLLNPWLVIRPLLFYPNLWIAALAVSSLIWNQYSLLTPIRYVINPRFNIEKPIQSALFFLPPGLGYLSGSIVGGRWSDRIVARFIEKRGRRVPEDRLRAAVPLMALAVPGSMVIYGWAIDKAVGGIPLVVVSMFAQGFLQLCCMPSLNTYCIDVMQEKGQSSVVVAGNYLTRFLFAAAASAACLPAIEAIGVGWFSTISGGFIAVNAALLWLLAQRGERWRMERDA
ncbi:major facilitator superfamily domain-containing protein [Plectosphaerella plurivora]|uniref:Major facilitator superfamily domain-containing protein n=1 Tax=Plectosphaerella plurivora TaxID=936078 RepID=A0A9P9A9M7_9PEZI|nr:major facilitator superfamily domain-containing protein [Plectosphaerella plurivora]